MFTAAYDRQYEQHGTAATYTPKGGVAVDVVVRKSFDGADKTGAHMTVKVRTSEVADMPGYGDVFVVGGKSWTVETVLGRAEGTNAYQWAVQCGADPRADWRK